MWEDGIYSMLSENSRKLSSYTENFTPLQGGGQACLSIDVGTVEKFYDDVRFWIHIYSERLWQIDDNRDKLMTIIITDTL